MKETISTNFDENMFEEIASQIIAEYPEVLEESCSQADVVKIIKRALTSDIVGVFKVHNTTTVEDEIGLDRLIKKTAFVEKIYDPIYLSELIERRSNQRVVDLPTLRQNFNLWLDHMERFHENDPSCIRIETHGDESISLKVRTEVPISKDRIVSKIKTKIVNAKNRLQQERDREKAKERKLDRIIDQLSEFKDKPDVMEKIKNALQL